METKEIMKQVGDLTLLNKQDLTTLGTDIAIAYREEAMQNPSAVVTQLRKMIAVAEAACKELNPDLIDELYKADANGLKVNGAKIEKSHTANTYNWSEDVEYKNLDNAAKARKALVSTANKYKADGIDALVVDGEGAEVHPVNIKTHGKEIAKVTL